MLTGGVRIVLAGSPNTGKSSLLNCLLREQRAIVTAVAGTTRDVLREELNLNGLPVQLIDTAGLRAADDVVERIGIDRARDTCATRELVDAIAVIHLPQMVDEQKADAELVGKLLEDTKLGVVTAVGNIWSGCTDELKGVDGYEGYLRVLPFELTEPIADSAFDGGASRSKIQPFGNVVRDGVQALLNPPLAVFQAEVEHFSPCYAKPPQGRSLGDVDA